MFDPERLGLSNDLSFDVGASGNERDKLLPPTPVDGDSRARTFTP